MKIVPNNTPNNIYSGKNEALNGSSNLQKDNKSGRIAKNFDEIIIKSKKTTASTDKFVSDLTSKLSEEVKKDIPNENLEEIKKQIDENTYNIDLYEVIKKILLD